MKVGTPGFVGIRLREAREARLLRGNDLAEMVGITRAAISSFERGHSSPSPTTLDRIAEKLNFKIAFFLRPEPDTAGSRPQTIFERSRTSATKLTRQRARHRQVWLREILEYINEFVTLPPPNVPQIHSASYWSSMAPEYIEDVARQSRRHWNLSDGPISNVTLLTEKHGIIVTMIRMDAPTLDAFSTWDPVDGRPYIVLGDDGQSPFRSRYNVCHELGHLILHRDVLPVEFNNPGYFKIAESQADRFAAAFLTPSESFSPNIATPSLDTFRTLKSRWRVSIKMMIHRAHDLNIIDSEEARRFYINYNRRRWNRQEPMDDTHPLEVPRLVRRAFEIIVKNEVIERSQIEADLPFNREDIERLANLPAGYLDDPEDVWAVREAYDVIREMDERKR